ncbi:elongation factor g, domain IV domain-containing protein [Ditylenchus destructor]|nr:elongation factor g, domain IV domain-containing protein [Ditylenchus destructor]
MAGAHHLRRLAEDHLHVGQRVAAQPAARDGGAGAARLRAGARFRIRQIDPVGAGQREVGIDRDAQQPACPLSSTLGHAGERRLRLAGRGQPRHRAALLRHQQLAVGQLRDAPGTVQARVQRLQGRRRGAASGPRRRLHGLGSACGSKRRSLRIGDRRARPGRCAPMPLACACAALPLRWPQSGSTTHVPPSSEERAMSPSPTPDSEGLTAGSPGRAALPEHPGIAAIRSLALVGPAGAGKTSLAEALLLKAGALTSAGNVEKGRTVSDHDPLEKRMLHSLQTSLMHLRHDGLRVHLVDTPGAADFIGQALPALEAVESALVVVNAQTGLELMAKTHDGRRRRARADAAGRREQDRRARRERAGAARAATSRLRPRMSAAEPARRERHARHRLLLRLRGDSDFGSVEAAHRALVEQVVEVDPDFVDRYLNDGDVPATELHAPLEQALREGHLIPVCFVSARTGAGVAELLNVIEKLLPNPYEANPPQFLRGEGDEAEPLLVAMDPAQHVVAHVFKIQSDPYLGKLAMLRVHQGTLKKNALLFVGHARKGGARGPSVHAAGQGACGDRPGPARRLCALAKLEELHFDAVLHDAQEDEHLHLSAHRLADAGARHRHPAQPARRRATAVGGADPAGRGGSLSAPGARRRPGRAEPARRRDAGLRPGRAASAGAAGPAQGDLQVRRPDPPPRIAYRETISAPAEGHSRHKKQTGGAGQFGEVWLRVEPLPRGAGFEFVDEVKGGAIPGQFMQAVEKGVRQALARGIVAGYPVVDLKVTVFDGKHHSVDSKEVAFIAAGHKAVVAAVREARPVVLEPIVQVEISAPEHATGDITGDLASRRGQVLGTRSGCPARSVSRDWRRWRSSARTRTGSTR